MMAKSIPEYNTESEEDYQINNGNETSTTKRRTKRSRSWTMKHTFKCKETAMEFIKAEQI